MVARWLQPLDGSPGHQITNFPNDTVRYYAYSAGGKSLAVMRTHVDTDVVLLHDGAATAASKSKQ